jgi:hypothetical protein
MNFSRQTAAVLTAAITFIFSCAMKPIEADQAAISNTERIIFLSTHNPKSFIVSTLDSRNTVGMSQVIFGFAAGLVATTIAETALEAKIKKNLDGQELGTLLHAAILERLEANGYFVESVALKRQKPGELLKKYSDLSDLKLPGDSYLDVAIEGGYTDRHSEKVALCPLLSVDLRFVRKPSRVMFAQNYEYSCRKKELSTIKLVPVDEKYKFADHNTVANNPELAREAVSAGIPLIADAIAAVIKKATQ